MKLVTRVAWVVPVLAVAVFVAGPSVVYAHNGEDETTSTSGTSGSSGNGRSSNETEQENSTDDSTMSGKNRVKLEDAKKDFQDHMRSKGSELLEQAKKDKKDAMLSSTERIQKCESRKQGLDQKLANIVKNAQKYQTRVDTVFTKAQKYKTDNNVTIENWDTLVAAATDAQTKAKASVDVLSTLKTTVDCNSETVAADVATFKAAVSQARGDLHTYRKAVKDLVKAVKEAKEAAATTSATDTSSTTEGAN